MAHHPRSESRWGGPRAAFAALLAGAAALRLVGVQYGLPYGLLDPGEQSIVPRAWRMADGAGLDPHPFFDHPPLVMYALAPGQVWQDEPSYLAARLVVVALGVAGVAAAWWLGSRAYGGPVPGFVAAAAVAVGTTHVAYSRTAVEDVPLALGVAASLALLASGRLEWAGLVAGLTAAVKFPGLFLVVPLVAVGWQARRRLVFALALGTVAFAAASPYVLVHAGEAAADAWRGLRLAREGALGFEHDHPAPIAFLDRLWEGFGPALLVAGLGLALALARRKRADLALASFVLAYFAGLLALDAHFDRYVLPLVPALGALAARLRWLAPVTALLLVVPLVWSIRDAHRLTRTDTRVVAERWLQEHLPPDTLIAVDPSLPPLARFRVLRLGLPGPKRPSDPRRDLGRLREEGVDDVLVTGAVADPVLAARERYPREARFYDELREQAQRVYYAEAGSEAAGPWVALYRL